MASAALPWNQMRKHLGCRPLVSRRLRGAQPLQVERYVLQRRSASMPAFRTWVLGVHLGGAQAVGGEQGGAHVEYVQNLCLLVPPGTSTDWRFHGAIDFGAFYFPDAALVSAFDNVAEPCHFADYLVTALCRQLVDELQRGPGGDDDFMAQLAATLITQLGRVSRGLVGRRMSAAPGQLPRLGQALAWVREHLADDLTTEALAARAGVSGSHFHRLFCESMGMTPQRYVRQRRLEQAADLLINSQAAIAVIAARCGFESQSHLTSTFARAYGMTPARYRRAGTP